MRTLIYQYYRDKNKPSDGPSINAGYNYWDLSKQSISSYAEKCGADYKFLNHDFGHAPFYGIFLPFIEGWCEEYDAICFIDSDVLALNNFDNIFDHMKDDCVNYVQMGVKSRDAWLDSKGGHGNTGCVIFPKVIYKEIGDYFTRNIKNPPSGKMGGWDQQMVNLFVIEQKKFHSLPKKFNWHMTRWDKTKRWDQTLVHYHRENKKLMKVDFTDERIMK